MARALLDAVSMTAAIASAMTNAGRVAAALIALTGCHQFDGPLEIDDREQANAVCADSTTIYGIDVSRFQGDIEWQKVADSGVVYAWIQISRSVTDLDAKFDFNWQQAKEVGILRGAYQRFQPGQDVALQAEIFLDRLGPFEPGDLPPMLDVEDSNGLGPEAIADAARQWLDIVEGATGVTPIIYTGFYFWRDEVGGPDFTRYPLWVPNYSADCPLVPPQWDRWTLHQYSSSAVIPGITANTVDVNRFNGTLADLQALAAPVCGDGVCTGGETADSCVDDCPPCQLIPESGAIVDDDGACFFAGGNPAYIRQEADGIGGSLRWTHSTDDPQPANYAQWNLHLQTSGRYRVEVHTPSPHAMSQRAIYRVAHGGAETVVEVDQTEIDGWRTIGDLDFAAGGGQSIRVDDNTGEPNESNTRIVFDAVRLINADGLEPPEPDEGDRVSDDEAGGCAIGGASQSSGATVATLFAFLFWRQRR